MPTPKTSTKLIEVGIDELTPHPKNPKLHYDAGIEDSIRKNGYVEPIIVNEKKVIIAGEGRWRACKRLGFVSVHVVQKKFKNAKEELEYLLASNKLTERGGWNKDVLKEFDPELLLSGYFDVKEVDDIFRNNTAGDDYNVNVALENPMAKKIKLGDMWELGEHRLICGDSTKPEYYKKLMGTEIANMVFTDPPYNIDYKGGMNSKGKNKRSGIKNDKMGKSNFRDFLYDAISNMMTYCNGSFYICMSSSEIDSLKDAFESAGGHWQSFIIWAKNTFTLSRSDYQNQFEPILYGWNGSNKKHYFAGYRDEGNVWEDLSSIKPKFDGTHTEIKVGDFHLKLEGEVKGQIIKKKDMTDLWREKKPTKSSEHPTMKPLELMNRAIRASSKIGEVVLDPFGGSGSTLISADRCNRKARIMELDPRYCAVIIERYEILSGKKAVKLK